jgi:hypothetical protein
LVANQVKTCALAYIDTHEAGWRNAKHAQQWRNTLQTYAYPSIGNLLVRDVELPQVLSILEAVRSDGIAEVQVRQCDARLSC